MKLLSCKDCAEPFFWNDDLVGMRVTGVWRARGAVEMRANATDDKRCLIAVIGSNAVP